MIWSSVFWLLLLVIISGAKAASECRALIDGEPKLPDDKFTASSSHRFPRHTPQQSRLGAQRTAQQLNWWAPQDAKVGEYLQVDVGLNLLTALAMEGPGDNAHNQYATKYKLSFSIDGVDWFSYDKTYNGNVNSRDLVNNSLTVPTYTRFVRFYGVEWVEFICLRWELYGCPVSTAKPVVRVTGTTANSVTISWPEPARHAGIQDESNTRGRLCYSVSVEHQNITVLYEVTYCSLAGATPRLTLGGLDPATSYRLSVFLEVRGTKVSEEALVSVTTSTEVTTVPSGPPPTTEKTSSTGSTGHVETVRFSSLNENIKTPASGNYGGLVAAITVAGCLVLVGLIIAAVPIWRLASRQNYDQPKLSGLKFHSGVENVAYSNLQEETSPSVNGE